MTVESILYRITHFCHCAHFVCCSHQLIPSSIPLARGHAHCTRRATTGWPKFFESWGSAVHSELFSRTYCEQNCFHQQGKCLPSWASLLFFTSLWPMGNKKVNSFLFPAKISFPNEVPSRHAFNVAWSQWHASRSPFPTCTETMRRQGTSSFL